MTNLSTYSPHASFPHTYIIQYMEAVFSNDLELQRLYEDVKTYLPEAALQNATVKIQTLPHMNVWAMFWNILQWIPRLLPSIRKISEHLLILKKLLGDIKWVFFSLRIYNSELINPLIYPGRDPSLESRISKRIRIFHELVRLFKSTSWFLRINFVPLPSWKNLGSFKRNTFCNFFSNSFFPISNMSLFTWTKYF